MNSVLSPQDNPLLTLGLGKQSSLRWNKWDTQNIFITSSPNTSSVERNWNNNRFLEVARHLMINQLTEWRFFDSPHFEPVYFSLARLVLDDGSQTDSVSDLTAYWGPFCSYSYSSILAIWDIQLVWNKWNYSRILCSKRMWMWESSKSMHRTNVIVSSLRSLIIWWLYVIIFCADIMIMLLAAGCRGDRTVLVVVSRDINNTDFCKYVNYKYR